MTDRNEMISRLKADMFWLGYHPQEQQLKSHIEQVIELLKEQEALPIVYRNNTYTGLPMACCPSCDECLLQFHAGAYGKETKFCYYCGQELIWNG